MRLRHPQEELQNSFGYSPPLSFFHFLPPLFLPYEHLLHKRSTPTRPHSFYPSSYYYPDYRHMRKRVADYSALVQPEDWPRLSQHYTSPPYRQYSHWSLSLNSQSRLVCPHGFEQIEPYMKTLL